MADDNQLACEFRPPPELVALVEAYGAQLKTIAACVHADAGESGLKYLLKSQRAVLYDLEARFREKT